MQLAPVSPSVTQLPFLETSFAYSTPSNSAPPTTLHTSQATSNSILDPGSQHIGDRRTLKHRPQWHSKPYHVPGAALHQKPHHRPSRVLLFSSPAVTRSQPLRLNPVSSEQLRPSAPSPAATRSQPHRLHHAFSDQLNLPTASEQPQSQPILRAFSLQSQPSASSSSPAITRSQLDRFKHAKHRQYQHPTKKLKKSRILSRLDPY